MDDKELIEVIATSPEIMGWEKGKRTDSHGYWVERNGDDTIERCYIFNPLESDADCMMAWDKFSESNIRQTELSFSPKVDNTNEGTWTKEKYWFAFDGNGHGARNKDRCRAMCECMAKAVCGE